MYNKSDNGIKINNFVCFREIIIRLCHYSLNMKISEVHDSAALYCQKQGILVENIQRNMDIDWMDI